jgi:two-component system, response regulator PdtaR
MFDNIASFPAAPFPLRTVLVVEDQVLIRMMVAERLRNRGFKVVEAQNAQEAITLLQSQVSVDLVFTDIRLPGSIDGLALSRFLRDTYPDLKIIVTSGDLAVGSRMDAVDAFFPKPYDVGSVIRRIGELLGDLDQ